MKILKLLFLFFLIVGIQTELSSQFRFSKKSNLKLIKPRSKNSIHFNFGLGYSFHYQPIITTYKLLPTRDLRVPLKQRPTPVLHWNFSINHLLFPKQEVFLGIGYSEFGWEENGLSTRPETPFSTTLITEPYKSFHWYSYINIFIGHRYIFSSKNNLNFFLENSLNHDWSESLYNLEYEIMNRSGFSYQTKFGGRLIYKDKRKILASIFFKSAIVKYNLEKIDKNYYPFSFGVDLAIAFSFRK